MDKAPGENSSAKGEDAAMHTPEGTEGSGEGPSWPKIVSGQVQRTSSYTNLTEYLGGCIRTIPDFPTPGNQFR